jgi:hypothetical protein
MKLLGLALGIDVGDENDLGSKMETDNGTSSPKKETPPSKPTTTTTTNKPAEANKNSAAQQTPVRHFILSFY